MTLQPLCLIHEPGKLIHKKNCPILGQETDGLLRLPALSGEDLYAWGAPRKMDCQEIPADGDHADRNPLRHRETGIEWIDADKFNQQPLDTHDGQRNREELADLRFVAFASAPDERKSKNA